MLVLVCGAVALLLTEFRQVQDPGLDKGQVARSDIRAPVKFEFVDEAVTQARIEAAVDGVAPVYDHDVLLAGRQQARISAAFQVGRSKYEQALLEAGDGGELSPEQTEQLGVVFADTLALTLKADDIAVLVASGFEPSIERTATELLGTAMKGRVVADRAALPMEVVPITVVRLMGEETEQTTLRSYDEIATTAGARQQITLALLEREDDGAHTRAAGAIARAAVRSNFSYNARLTEHRRLEAGQTVAPVVLSIDRGTTLVRAGDVVTAHQIALLEQMRQTTTGRSPWAVAGSLFAFCLLLLTSVYWFARATIRKFSSRRRDIEALGLLLVLTLLLGRLVVYVSVPLSASGEIAGASLFYLVPVAGVVLLVRILINSETALVFAVVAAVLSGLLMEHSATLIIYFIVSSVIAAGSIGKKRERSAILRAGIFTGVMNAAFVLLINLVQANLAESAGGAAHLNPGWEAVFAFVGGVVSAFLVLGMVPLFELVGFDTDLKLLELGNLDHPLLRNLMLRAPGSYHHSVMVGTLAEAAAEAIGANALLCRVCSYFHDIGKAVRPAYFVENQRDGVNRHERLGSHQSARVIIDHVLDGGKIAKKHKLPRPVIDNIYMHHGTGLVHYFYNKARAAAWRASNPKVDPSDFRYPGPKPNTREAGIIMLADKIEAACRSIRDPNPENVAAMIQKIINSVMAEGQFSQCPLTVKEITVIADVLKKTVLAIHHHRIEYPEPRPFVADGEDPDETEAVDEPVITLEIPASDLVLETSGDDPPPEEEGLVDYESPEYLPGWGPRER
ncbi:MAG TPA: HDIG domain-containing protein [Myxococcota bacterium]|nr:HDIG domain-containing protein [Myxococcota bacterium]